MFVVATSRDKFTHRVGDITSLTDLIFGLTDDTNETKRIATIAKQMKSGEAFTANGIAILRQEDK